MTTHRKLLCALLAAGFTAIAQNPRPWAPNPKIVEQLTRRGDANYDEAEVPPYHLPEALKTRAGAAVTSPAMWNAKRRPELLDMFRDHVYGRRPATKFSISFRQEAERADALDGAATARSMIAKTTIGTRSFEFPFVVFIPNRRPGKVPAVVHINNRRFIPIETVTAGHDPFWAVRAMIQRGYATASFFTSHVDPDNKDGYAQGIRAFFADGKAPGDNDWGALSAWGWAASRVLDYLETVNAIDAARIAVSGHSRGGKSALWAASEDTRFALAYSNDSGCAGAALSRRLFGETVARIYSAFPYWFCRNFGQYAGRENDLPMDQHELIALIAPRAVYVASADEDLWADPKGEYASLVAASPVFNLFGKRAITNAEMPPIEQPTRVGVTGYHIRPGGHGLQDNDWRYFLDFADTCLKR